MSTVAALCRPGSETLAIGIDAPADQAIALFRQTPDLRLLPIVDDRQQPVGALFEADIREILFNPYGHALIRNPGFARCLRVRIRPCPTIDIGVGLGEMLAAYAQAGGREGMIVTSGGRYRGLIENTEMIAAAGAYELDRITHREVELNRLRAAGWAFESDIAGLSHGLSAVALDLGQTAAATAERGAATGRHAGLVAAAAQQTGDAICDVAMHGTALVETLDLLHSEAASARTAAQEAVALVARGAAQADALQRSAHSIETITRLIDTLAGKVNMLAINATIEAARAGDAGRGFAVVAQEVRGLAGQTRTAAEDIRRHAVDVRGAVDDVVVGQGGIARVVAGVERMSATVEATVDAQRTRTRDVSQGAEQVAAAARDIQRTVDAIAETAQAAATGAGVIDHTARALASSAEQLNDRVDAFLAEIRSA